MRKAAKGGDIAKINIILKNAEELNIAWMNEEAAQLLINKSCEIDTCSNDTLGSMGMEWIQMG